jgi:hypothetical protein
LLFYTKTSGHLGIGAAYTPLRLSEKVTLKKEGNIPMKNK